MFDKNHSLNQYGLTGAEGSVTSGVAGITTVFSAGRSSDVMDSLVGVSAAGVVVGVSAAPVSADAGVESAAGVSAAAGVSSGADFSAS